LTWQIFDRAAARYEAWYSTPPGQRADAAERGLLLYLLESFPNARSGIEIGCGTGHFTNFLARYGLRIIGLDSAPAMLIQARRNFPSLPLVLGDAYKLPFRDRCVDLSVFVTTLEFLSDPAAALREAVRVARFGVIALVLNRNSLGGLSRRWGPQSRGALLGQARDLSIAALKLAMRRASGDRQENAIFRTTLFPDGLSSIISRVALGDVIGGALVLKK
jgi:ubiquinone/menaquinone biosynthesis C-methylase UbiE